MQRFENKEPLNASRTSLGEDGFATSERNCYNATGLNFLFKKGGRNK
jgi:hypothetical protein